MKAVITGATGAIGGALIRELLNRGDEILVLYREGSSRNGRILSHPNIKTAACSLDAYENFTWEGDSDYDVFYHLAWNGTTGPFRNDWHLQNRNVAWALDAVKLASRLGCRHFIGVGSQAEYGRVEGLLRPDTPVHPENGYGIAKLSAGWMTREYAHELGLAHNWVRVLSVYGPGDGGQSLVMSAIRSFREDGKASFTKGEQVWDYLNSADAARALRMIGACGKTSPSAGHRWKNLRAGQRKACQAQGLYRDHPAGGCSRGGGFVWSSALCEETGDASGGGYLRSEGGLWMEAGD